MADARALLKRREPARIARYVVNGVIATAVHYSVLSFNLQVVGIASAGLANGMAACFGIAASFLGSRYYVFRATHSGITSQAKRFALLYIAIAVLHGLVLYVWTDLCRLDYRAGFLLATAMQMLLSYIGLKTMVFPE